MMIMEQDNKRYQTVYSKTSGLIIIDKYTNPRPWSGPRISDKDIVGLLNEKEDMINDLNVKLKLANEKADFYQRKSTVLTRELSVAESQGYNISDDYYTYLKNYNDYDNWVERQVRRANNLK